MGEAFDGFDLGVQMLPGAQRGWVVVGHVDDGRDPAGNGGSGGWFDPGKAEIAARMGLAVNNPRQDERISGVVHGGGRRGFTFSDCMDDRA